MFLEYVLIFGSGVAAGALLTTYLLKNDEVIEKNVPKSAPDNTPEKAVEFTACGVCGTRLSPRSARCLVCGTLTKKGNEML